MSSAANPPLLREIDDSRLEALIETMFLAAFADGVLAVCVGEATKVVQLLQADDKAYEATVRFGSETDTLDAEGKVTGQAPVPEPLDLEPVLARFKGRYLQTPPMYSAVKVKGRKLYEAAGFETVEAHAVGRSMSAERLLYNVGIVSKSRKFQQTLWGLSQRLGLDRMKLRLNLRDMQRACVRKVSSPAPPARASAETLASR